MTVLDRLRHESRQRTEAALLEYRKLLSRFDDLDGAADLADLKGCMATLALSEAHVEADRAALAEAQAKARDVPTDADLERLEADASAAYQAALKNLRALVTRWVAGLDLQRLAAFVGQYLPEISIEQIKSVQREYQNSQWRHESARQQQQRGSEELRRLKSAHPRVFAAE